MYLNLRVDVSTVISTILCLTWGVGAGVCSSRCKTDSRLKSHEVTLFHLQQSKAKKKKKGVVPGGGLKATMKDDLADYGGYDGGYVQDYEDFM